jgi:hypothetical protein
MMFPTDSGNDVRRSAVRRRWKSSRRWKTETSLSKENHDMAELREQVRRVRDRLADDTGAATAEYAIATMAAVGFAGLLVVIMRSDEVRGILTDLVRRALTVDG